jgi:hypothetical protein
MASKTDICNQALTAIGDKRITAVTDDTERARLCDLLYDQSRLEVLELHPWGCALTRVSLAADAASPAWGYDYQYQLPADHVRIVTVDRVNDDLWEVEGRYLVTDQAGPVNIRYIKNLTQTGLFSPLLTQAVALRLAMWLSRRINTSSTKKKAVKEDYQQVMTEARNVDGRKRSEMPLTTQSWIQARP